MEFASVFISPVAHQVCFITVRYGRKAQHAAGANYPSRTVAGAVIPAAPAPAARCAVGATASTGILTVVVVAAMPGIVPIIIAVATITVITIVAAAVLLIFK